MKTLKEVKIGESVTIKRLHGEGALKRRIMDMGLTKGTEVYVRKVAPLGDPHGADGARIRAVRAQERCGKHRGGVILFFSVS